MQAFLSSWKSYAFSTTSTYLNSWWKASLLTQKSRMKQNQIRNRKIGGGGGGGRVSDTERKEKEEVEVWEHLLSTLGLFIWGGLGCLMWQHTHTHFRLSIKKVSDRWRRSLCVCHMHCCYSWFSPENTTRSTDKYDSPHSPMLQKVTSDKHDLDWPKPLNIVLILWAATATFFAPIHMKIFDNQKKQTKKKDKERKAGHAVKTGPWRLRRSCRSLSQCSGIGSKANAGVHLLVDIFSQERQLSKQLNSHREGEIERDGRESREEGNKRES